MDGLRDLTALVGRILLGAIFILSGFGKIVGFAGTEKVMAAHGIPLVPVALIVTILIEFGCSLLMVIGYQARWAALLVFLWFIPVTLMFHVAAYHHATEPMTKIIQETMVLKNISIMGGLLLVFSFGPGRWSVDGRSVLDLTPGTHAAA